MVKHVVDRTEDELNAEQCHHDDPDRKEMALVEMMMLEPKAVQQVEEKVRKDYQFEDRQRLLLAGCRRIPTVIQR